MTEFILALSVVFITAGVLLLFANQLNFPAVPFYLIAGLITGTVVAPAILLELALWGIAFLVFVFGTRINFGDLQTVLRDGEGAAFTQLIVVAPVALVVGYWLSHSMGFAYPFRNAIYFAAAATLSSTLVGRENLEKEIRNNLVHGRLASSVHLFDDLVAIGVILVLSAEVLTDAQLVTSKIGFGLLFILAGLVIYRHGFPLLMQAAEGSDELVLMGSISILIAFMAAAETVGVSLVVGAFAAGLAVRSEGATVLGVRNGIESIKDFFVAIFFVTLGALVTIPTVEVLILAGLLTGLVLIVNPLIHMTAFVLEGYDGRTGFLAGASLNQVSELALVIVIQAFLLGTIAPGLFDAIILAAAMTMLLSSVSGKYENAFFDRLIQPVIGRGTGLTKKHTSVTPGIRDHVVIIGFGRQARRLVAELHDLDEPYVVIENDPRRRDDLTRECSNYVFGDAVATYPLEQANIETARLVISTVDHLPVSQSILEAEPSGTVILRADSSREAQRLLEAGATYVAVPSLLAADQLVENVERVLGNEAEIETLEKDHLEFLQRIELAGLERRLGND